MRIVFKIVSTLSLLLCFSLQAETVSVMTFNVENLFDTHDDPGKIDETYLPAVQKKSPQHKARCGRIHIKKWRKDCLEMDWSEDVLAEKLRRIGKVIESVKEGRGPEIVLLQEVENLSVLNQLVHGPLHGMGYRAVLLEGEDERGIDVALLTRWPLAGTPRLHRIPFPEGFSKNETATRGVLEVPLRSPEGNLARVFVVHLPSAFHPALMRKAALAFVTQMASHSPRELVIIGGDFNVSAGEERKHREIARYAEGAWRVSHFEGCKSCPGTTFYRGWSFFDQIWMSRSSERQGWRLVPSSVRLVNELPFQREPGSEGPWRFGRSFWGNPQGLSDHWPLLVELRKEPKTPKL